MVDKLSKDVLRRRVRGAALEISRIRRMYDENPGYSYERYERVAYVRGNIGANQGRPGGFVDKDEDGKLCVSQDFTPLPNYFIPWSKAKGLINCGDFGVEGGGNSEIVTEWKPGELLTAFGRSVPQNYKIRDYDVNFDVSDSGLLKFRYKYIGGGSWGNILVHVR